MLAGKSMLVEFQKRFWTICGMKLKVGSTWLPWLTSFPQNPNGIASAMAAA